MITIVGSKKRSVDAKSNDAVNGKRRSVGGSLMRLGIINDGDKLMECSQSLRS
jgi:hypothetical protein